MGLTFPGNCDEDTKIANAKAAMKLVPNLGFAPITVKVTDRDPANGKFSFIALGKDGNTHEYKDVEWGNNKTIWVCCPSTLPSTCNDPEDKTNRTRPPNIGISGDLYFEGSFADALKLKHGTPKWPGSAAFDGPFAEITVMPSKILLTGIELEDGLDSEATVDVGDFALADIHHALVLNPAGTKLRLSKAGFTQFGVPFPTFSSLNEDVTNAVATIQAAATDARAMARAWAVIATAVAKIENDPGTAAESLIALVREVMPGFEPGGSDSLTEPSDPSGEAC